MGQGKYTFELWLDDCSKKSVKVKINLFKNGVQYAVPGEQFVTRKKFKDDAKCSRSCLEQHGYEYCSVRSRLSQYRSPRTAKRALFRPRALAAQFPYDSELPSTAAKLVAALANVSAANVTSTRMPGVTATTGVAARNDDEDEEDDYDNDETDDDEEE